MVNDKYPEHKNFHNELTFVKEVEQYSMENIITDTRQLEKDNTMTKTELENRIEDLAKQTKAGGDNKSKAAQNVKLQEFYDRSTGITSKLKKDSEACQKAFNECAEYFGETTSSKTDISVSTFFGYFVRFIAAWKLAETENEKRKQKLKAEADRAASKNKNTLKAPSTDKVTMRNRQNDLINELTQRTNTKSISPQDIQDGQFENIILGMRSEPYRTKHVENGEINRRSFRRQRSSNSQKLTDESEPL